MMLKQSTAVVISFGPFVDKTDGVTPEVGLVSALDHGTTGILLSKNGGALTIRNATVTATTYDTYGNYRVTLNTTDTNTLGSLRMQFIETATCLPVWLDFEVVTANIWDSFHSTDILDVSMTQILGTAVATPATAGLLDVNVKQISTDGTAADNFETMLDGTGGQVLSLGQLNIVASSNNSAIVATGAGTGHGVLATGGATGDGMKCVGGATSGAGLNAVATTQGHGMSVTGAGTTKHGLSLTPGTNGNALDARGVSGGSGIIAVGGTTGIGMGITGGSTSGQGLLVSATSGNGIQSTGGLTGAGLRLQGGVTAGHGIEALGAGGGADINADISGTITAVTTATNLTNAATAGDLTATMKASVNTEADAALVDVNLDHLVGIATGIPAIVAGTYIDMIMDDGTAVYNRTTDSLQAIRDTAPLGTVMRGTDSAALASVCTETRLAELDAANLPTDVATIDDFLDTEIAAIKAKTDSLTFTGAGRVDANVAAVNNNTGGVAGLDRAARCIVVGTVGSGSTTTSVVTSSVSPVGVDADQFKGAVIAWDKDTTTTALRGQRTDITASTGAAAPTFTVTALTIAPVSGDTFVVE